MKTEVEMKAACFNLIRQMQREDWVITKPNGKTAYNDAMQIILDKGFTKEQSEKIVAKAFSVLLN